MTASSALAATVALAAAGTPGVVFAATDPTVAECAGIDDDNARLACYDQASGRTADDLLPALADQPAQPAAGLDEDASLIDAAWGFHSDSPRYIVDLYEPNYILVGRYSDDVNTEPFVPLFAAAGEPVNLDNWEAKFQLSMKFRTWTTDDRRWGLWVGYTQQSQWQVYNGDSSHPFRETNYMPELFVSYRPGLELGGFHWNLLNVGYNHQSNGRSDILSRSWDRIFVTAGLEKGNFALLAKAWHAYNDETDNPDITDFYGFGSLRGIFKWRGHSFSLMARGNIAEGNGAAEFTWMSPRLFGPIRAYVQGFSGYGESMIDYNWSQTTIGAGIALNDAL